MGKGFIRLMAAYFARLCGYDRWVPDTKGNLSSISGEAITIDLSCADNEWSVFRFDTNYERPSEDPKAIVLAAKMISMMLHKVSFDCFIVFISEQFLNGLNATFSPAPYEDEGELGELHYNITDVRFALFRPLADRVLGLFEEEPGSILCFNLDEILSLLQRHPDQLVTTDVEKLRNRKGNFAKLFNRFKDDGRFLDIQNHLTAEINSLKF